MYPAFCKSGLQKGPNACSFTAWKASLVSISFILPTKISATLIASASKREAKVNQGHVAEGGEAEGTAQGDFALIKGVVILRGRQF